MSGFPTKFDTFPTIFFLGEFFGMSHFASSSFAQGHPASSRGGQLFHHFSFLSDMLVGGSKRFVDAVFMYLMV